MNPIKNQTVFVFYNGQLRNTVISDIVETSGVITHYITPLGSFTPAQVYDSPEKLDAALEVIKGSALRGYDPLTSPAYKEIKTFSSLVDYNAAAAVPASLNGCLVVLSFNTVLADGDISIPNVAMDVLIPSGKSIFSIAVNSTQRVNIYAKGTVEHLVAEETVDLLYSGLTIESVSITAPGSKARIYSDIYNATTGCVAVSGSSILVVGNITALASEGVRLESTSSAFLVGNITTVSNQPLFVGSDSKVCVIGNVTSKASTEIFGVLRIIGNLRASLVLATTSKVYIEGDSYFNRSIITSANTGSVVHLIGGRHTTDGYPLSAGAAELAIVASGTPEVNNVFGENTTVDGYIKYLLNDVNPLLGT